MIGGEIQPQGYPGTEVPDGFKLKTADFKSQHIVMLTAGNHLTQRDAMITAGDRSAPASPKNMGNQLRAGALAVGAGDGHHGHVGEIEGKLHLAIQWHTCIREFFWKRPACIKSGADDDSLILTGAHHEVSSLLSTDSGKALSMELIQGALNLHRISLIKHGHVGTVHSRQTRSTEPAATGTENGEMLSREKWHDQRSFKVARPSNAKRRERIQKRTMTWFSCQPPNSKWW